MLGFRMVKNYAQKAFCGVNLITRNIEDMEVNMNKRNVFVLVFTILVAGLVFAQQQDRTTGQQGQTTRPKQDKTTGQQGQTSKSQSNTGSTTQQGDMKVASDDKNFVMKAAQGGMSEVEMGQIALRQASNDEVKRFAQRMVDDHSKANQELMQLAQSKGITLPASMGSGTGNNMNSSGQGSSSSTSSQQGTGTGSSTSGQQGTGSSTSGQQGTGTGQQTGGTAGQQNTKTGSGQQNDRTGVMSTNQDSGTAMKGNADHRKMMDKMSKLSGADFDREYMKQQVADHDKTVALFEKQSKNGKDAELKAFADRTLPTLREHQQMAKDINSRVGGKMDSSDKGMKKDAPNNKSPK
jgi:putative membrane protein